MAYSLDFEKISRGHRGLDFVRIQRTCELNAFVCFKAISTGGSREISAVLRPPRYTLDGSIWLPQDFFEREAPDYLKRSRRSLNYGNRVILRGTRYSISANPTFEVRQKLHDIQEDFRDGLEALREVDSPIFGLAIADYIKNAAVTYTNSLVAGEKVGKLAFGNPAYQSLRRDACGLVQSACDLFYGMLILNRALYSSAFDKISASGLRVMQAIEARILSEYKDGSFSSRHFSRPEASHPLVIGGFALRLAMAERVSPEVIIGLPAGSTELAYAVRSAFQVFRKIDLPVLLVPASVHSIKHDFDEPSGNRVHVEKILEHFKGRIRNKKVLVVDDNSSTGKTADIVKKGLEGCKPASVSVLVAEADIIRSQMRKQSGDLSYVASTSLYARSVNVLPVSKFILPRFDLRQLNERRRMISCVRRRYIKSSDNPISRVIGQIYVDLIRVPNMSTDDKNSISSFRHTFLSNFYPCEVMLESEAYTSVEHAYQRAKIVESELSNLTDEHVSTINKKLAVRDVRIGKDDILRFFSSEEAAAGTSKIIGNQLRILGFVRNDWDHVKLPIMTALVIQKFSREDFFEMLSQTGDRLLIEGNDWGDTYWGVVGDRGRNVLGRLLMILRSMSCQQLQQMTLDIERLGVPNFDTSRVLDPTGNLA